MGAAITENPLDLSGRRVLVTGASAGIGRDVAVFLSSLNARLVLVGRNEDRLRQTLAIMRPDDHRVEPFDLTATEQIPDWLRRVTTDAGPLHGLVHAAGKQLTAPIRLLSVRSIDDIMKTNLHSAMMLARGFCASNCHAPHSSIVFLSSVMAIVGKPTISVYCASKAALIGFTKSLALELAADSIRVNCVAPAFVQTEMLDRLRQSLSPDQFTALEKAHPLGFGTPRDVSNAVAFLLADTSRWVTGSTLVVDGGYSIQ